MIPIIIFRLLRGEAVFKICPMFSRHLVSRAPRLRVLLCALASIAMIAPALVRAQDPADADRLEITYLGNEGFLLGDGRHTVLIDALYGDGLSGYAAVDEEVRSAIESGQPPYDEVDIVLATHHHADHFNALAVARHLRANPRSVFLSTPQAVERMKREVEGFASLEHRAHGILPSEGTRHTVRLLGLDIELLNLHHGRERNPPVENLGFLLELGGRRLLHVGDTMATGREFADYGVPNDRVDIAFLPVWLTAYEPWETVVSEGISPAELIIMHLPVPDAPDTYFSPFDGLGGLLQAVETRHPGARVFHSDSLDETALSPTP